MELIKTNPKSHVLLLPIFQVRRDNYLKKTFLVPFMEVYSSVSLNTTFGFSVLSFVYLIASSRI